MQQDRDAVMSAVQQAEQRLVAAQRQPSATVSEGAAP
jgi:hypothetical protein